MQDVLYLTAIPTAAPVPVLAAARENARSAMPDRCPQLLHMYLNLYPQLPETMQDVLYLTAVLLFAHVPVPVYTVPVLSAARDNARRVVPDCSPQLLHLYMYL